MSSDTLFYALCGSSALVGAIIAILVPRRGPSALQCIGLAVLFVAFGYLAAFSWPGFVSLTIAPAFLVMALVKAIAEIVFRLRHRTSSQ